MTILKHKKLRLLALFTFLSIQVKAQSDFRPGYVINTQGDSINGFINYRNDIKNTEECIFQKELNSNKVIYKPHQLKSYGFIDGKYYISNNSQNFKSVPNVFLEYISKGSINIFYYRDNTQGHYIASKDTLIVELNHLVNNVNTSTNSTLTKSDRYKDQLKFLMRDQPTIF